MQASRLGRIGEWAGLVLLVLKGYRMCHRGWRGPSGELDLVMQRRREVVFVEVKTRSGTDFGGAAAAVHAKKRAAMVRTAAAYLSRFGLWERPCRFDVITIERGGALGWRIQHHADAFQPDLGRNM